MENKKVEKNTRKSFVNEEEYQTNSNARMFASSSNLGGQDDQKKEDDRTQKQHLSIIKRILDMFNLEETKKKYESQNVVEFVLDPNDFGYDCSLSTTRVRQRLCDLMGTDVIRLNDKRYFQKLSERLGEEYDSIMDKQEDARAASENQRLRRLMLEGVIDTPNDYRAVIQGDHKKKLKKKKKRKSKKLTSDGRPTSGYDESNATMTSHGSDNEDDASSKTNEVVTQVEIVSGSRPSSHTSQNKRRAPTPKGRRSSTSGNTSDEPDDSALSKSLKEMHARPPHHEGALRSSSPCSTHRKSRRIKSAAARLNRRTKDRDSDESDEGEPNAHYDTRSLPGRDYTRKPSKFSKHEPERIRNLRTEETVAGLYSLAEELVSPVKVEDKKERKVIVKPKKMTMRF